MVAQELKKTLASQKETHRQTTRTAVRIAPMKAAKSTYSVGGEAGTLAREAAKGAVHAVGEVGGETRSFIKDTIIGILDGTAEVVRVTTPAVREAVVGAMRGSARFSKEVEAPSREAVEGAIVGATSVGVDATDATVAAVEGALEAVEEMGGDLGEAAKAVVGGVVSAMATTGGDVAHAAKGTTQSMVAYAAAEERSIEEIAGVAGRAVDAVLDEAKGTQLEVDEIVAATATGAVEAAYLVDRSHGDRVRQSVLRRILEAGATAAPEVERRFSKLAERLSEELPKGRAAWRGMALIRAGRLLLRIGGIDLAASLAYFTIMSFLPLAALILTAAALLGNSEVVSTQLTELLVYYFPASAELVRESVNSLTNQSLFIGAVAFVGLVMSANGLFLAANRSVNRIFEIEARGPVRLTIAEIALATIIASLFLLSLGITALHQVVLTLGQDFIQVVGPFSPISAVTLGIVSMVLPAAFTLVMFAIVYYRLPNVDLKWRDAVFGATVGIVLFEIAKHLFFWFTNLTSQRNAVYGPIASIVVMMTWAYIAGMIFLYGAAITRTAGELRPGTNRKFSS